MVVVAVTAKVEIEVVVVAAAKMVNVIRLMTAVMRV